MSEVCGGEVLDGEHVVICERASARLENGDL